MAKPKRKGKKKQALPKSKKASPKSKKESRKAAKKGEVNEETTKPQQDASDGKFKCLCDDIESLRKSIRQLKVQHYDLKKKIPECTECIHAKANLKFQKERLLQLQKEIAIPATSTAQNDFLKEQNYQLMEFLKETQLEEEKIFTTEDGGLKSNILEDMKRYNSGFFPEFASTNEKIRDANRDIRLVTVLAEECQLVLNDVVELVSFFEQGLALETTCWDPSKPPGINQRVFKKSGPISKKNPKKKDASGVPFEDMVNAMFDKARGNKKVVGKAQLGAIPFKMFQNEAYVKAVFVEYTISKAKGITKENFKKLLIDEFGDQLKDIFKQYIGSSAKKSLKKKSANAGAPKKTSTKKKKKKK